MYEDGKDEGNANVCRSMRLGWRTVRSTKIRIRDAALTVVIVVDSESSDRTVCAVVEGDTAGGRGSLTAHRYK